MAATILIVDDEKAIRDSLSGILSDEGFAPLSAASAEQALQILDERQVDLVLLDIWMPGMDGLEALRHIRAHFEAPVVMISGHGSIETAVEATRSGAYDFIEKPLSYEKILLTITKGLEFFQMSRENKLLRERAPLQVNISGQSAAIVQLRAQIDRVAPSTASVLILGSHGTGKELVAQTIHRQSSRSRLPMIAVNCAAIPEELIESELFGHVKGAFTGANEHKKGKFDQANGSTLFLDEIGDMSLKSQAKVLRILQEQSFERVGGSRTISVDVRLLAATNKHLEQEIEAGRFRADLFYRLNVVPIRVPTLAERRQDIPLLVQEFIEQFSKKSMVQRSCSPEALRLLQAYDWPGNVRELRNLVERLMIMIPRGRIEAQDVELFLHPGGESPIFSGREQAAAMYQSLPFKEARRLFESDYLQAKLNENEGNITKTAEQIGMERSHLHKKVKALGITVKDERQARK